MIKKLVITTLIMASSVNALELFKADYTVYKDGKKIGVSSIELVKQNTSTQSKSLGVTNSYKLIDKTNGTHGMASFLGFKRSEETVFNNHNGLFSPKSYHMKQKVAFNKRKSHYKIDAIKQTAKGDYKGNKWEKNIPEVLTTPNLVSLALSKDICAGKTKDLSYSVLKKGKVQQYDFSINSQKDGIIEVDKRHDKKSRITKTWLDINQQCIPVKTYHKEEGEDVLESQLIKITFS